MTFSNPRTSGNPVAVKDEGVTVATTSTSIDFKGAGVTATASNADVTVTVPGGSAGNVAYNETPGGAVDSNNVTFTLANAPSPAGSLLLTLNGQVLTPGGVDFTLASTTITFVNAPPAGSGLLAKQYSY